MTNHLRLTAVRSEKPALTGLCLILLLGLSAPLNADTITVGANGDVAQIQAAVDLALATPASDQIRVQAPAVFIDSLDILLTSTTGDLSISGGWDATFTTTTSDPSLTVIDGDQQRVAQVQVYGGPIFSISNLTIRNGSGEGWAGGMGVSATDSSEVHINNVWFIDNSAFANSGSANGGGLYLSLDDAYAEINNNRFMHNLVRVTSSAPPNTNASGGGVWASFSGYLEFRNNVMEGNGCTRIDPTGSASGCSLKLGPAEGATYEIKGNTIVASLANGFEFAYGIAGHVECVSGGNGLMERNRWQSASVSSSHEREPLVEVKGHDGCHLTQRSSLFTGGPSDGLRVGLAYVSSWHGANLSVADNGERGLRLTASSTTSISLYNSISYGNADEDLYIHPGTTLDQGANLIDVNPDFVNAPGGYYQLRQGSVALEAGFATPPAGLSTFDLDGLPRVQGPSVDIGAYEGTSMVFADSFRTGDTSCWGD